MSTIHVTPELIPAVLAALIFILFYVLMFALGRRRAAQQNALREMARLRAQHAAEPMKWESKVTKRSVH